MDDRKRLFKNINNMLDDILKDLDKRVKEQQKLTALVDNKIITCPCVSKQYKYYKIILN